MGRNWFSRFNDIPHVCYACNETRTTTNSKGAPNWFLNLDSEMNLIGMLCAYCYSKHFHYPKIKPDINKRLFRYGSKMQWIGWGRVLTGRCTKCGNTTQRTQMHHWTYIRIFPWFGRIELCQRCHTLEGWKNGQYAKRWERRRAKRLLNYEKPAPRD